MSTLGGFDFPLVCGLSEAVRVEDEVEEDPDADEDDAACASTLAARAPRLCCPRRDSFGYSHVSPRRVHWLKMNG